ncbi:MAG: methyltransferase domain-containing protein [Alphaproteobacteria bacterium]|nr:methyltransferase domain-containing protein [Alphaproteobacteria bacterium]
MTGTGPSDPEAAVYARERRHFRPAAGRLSPGLLTCPICGTRAARFLPFGLSGRRNARCPGCGSAERHRFLWLYLTRRTRLLERRLRILHTAPEPCLAARLRARPNLRTVTVDRFDPAADRRADLTALPFADAAFNLVLSSHVLEHIPDDRAAIAEIARVLHPGGEAIIAVPFDPHAARSPEAPAAATPAARQALFGHPYHFRTYGRDLVDRLAEAGLIARRVDSTAILTPHRRRCFRINRNHLFHCYRTAAT